jgi:large subunit ribosomal protein L30
MSAGTLRITYVKSVDGYTADQAQTIRSLGFTRLHQTIEKTDTPDVRGMVNKVRHLVVIEAEDETPSTGRAARS